MTSPKESEFHISFPLDLGMDNTATDTNVQPLGDRPALVSSINTRLSKVRGIPTKAPGTTTPVDPDSRSGASACGGIIPCGHVSSSLVMRQKRYGAQRIAGAELSSLDSVLPDLSGVGNYWPADISRAGQLPGNGFYVPPAVCTLNSQIWVASFRPSDNSGNIGIFVTVLGANGEVVAAPEQVASVAGTINLSPWIGLTAHGVNGIRLWHKDGASNGVRIRTLTVASGDVSATSGTVLYTPTSSGFMTYDVTSHSIDYAWVVTLGAAAVGDVALTKVDIATNTVVSTVVTSVTTTTAAVLAVKSASMTAGTRVAVMVSLAAGTCTELLFNGDTMAAALHAFTGKLRNGRPACGFYRVGSTEYVCYGVFANGGPVAATGYTGITVATNIELRTVDATGTLVDTLVMQGVGFISNFIHHSPASGEIYPMILAQPAWSFGAGMFSPGAREYTSDPAVQVHRIDSKDSVSVIARVGVDTAAIYPLTDDSAGDTFVRWNSDAIYCDGDKIVFVYAETSWRAQNPIFPLRYVELDMTARQPRYAIGVDGSTIIAAAMPSVWDGTTLAECSPWHRPNVFVKTTGGSGDDLTDGDYIVSAVLSWRDASGAFYRSFPATLRTATMSSTNKMIIQVSAHPYVHDGAVQDSFDIEIYMTIAGGSAGPMYRQRIEATTKSVLFWEFADVDQPTASNNNPTIYTTAAAGLPLPNQAPPAMYDVAIVQDRAWMINGERRSELWYTKPKVRSPSLGSISYEWSSELVMRLPTAAGRGQAVVENNGILTILCENGAWVVTGPGPDASLTSGLEFNTPEQISDIACSSRDSVIRTPAGIMFRSNTRFAMIGPQGIRIIEEIDASSLGTIIPVLLRDSQEVIWFSSTGTHLVYNYSLDRWSQWSSVAVPAVIAGAYDPVSGLVNLVESSGNTVRQMNPATPSTTAQMSFVTGHVNTGGPQDDTTVTEVLIHAKNNASHGLSVTIQEDYGQGNSVTKNFSASELNNCTVNGQYCVSVSPQEPSMRASKVTIAETDSAGDAFRPLSVTLIGRKMPGTFRDAVMAQGRK